MRIVLLGAFALWPKGTVSQRALPLGKALARRGYDVTVLIPPYDNPAEAGRRAVIDGVTVENLPLGGGLLGLAARLASRARALRPDVVHCFKPTGPAALAALLLSASRPVVVDCDDWEGRGGFADSGAYPPWQAALLDWQERVTPRVARQVTAASRTLVARLRRRGLPARRLTYAPNCFDPANSLDPPDPAVVAAFAAAHRLDGSPVVLYLGHVPPANDLDLAVAALASLAEAGEPFQWLVVADGPGLDPLRARLPPALAARTRFVGRVDRATLPLVFAAARCLVVPVRDTPINRAKCAMKVVDAQAAGVPVVAPAVGQHREYVVHERTGLLTPPNDPYALPNAIRRLVRDPALALAMGARARERIRVNFTWDGWVAPIERAYRAALRR